MSDPQIMAISLQLPADVAIRVHPAETRQVAPSPTYPDGVQRLPWIVHLGRACLLQLWTESADPAVLVRLRDALTEAIDAAGGDPS